MSQICEVMQVVRLTWFLAVRSARFPPLQSACWKAGVVETKAANAIALPTLAMEARGRKYCIHAGKAFPFAW